MLLACDWFVKYTAGLAVGLSRGGADVLLLTRDHAFEFPSETGEDVVSRYVEGVTGGAVAHAMLGGRVRDPGGWRDAIAMRRRAAAFRPDVVHVQESVLNDPRLLVASGMAPSRYAATVHDPAPHPGDPLPGPVRRVGERRLVRHAGLLFVHSEVDRAALTAEFGAHGPVAVVPHGTDTPVAGPLPAEPAVLFFGRILPYKGLDVLLRSMPLVWERLPAARLVIAGEGEIPAHAALADPRVETRRGHVPEAQVPGLFAAARCVALPYTQASQSGVGSQAKAFGRPLIVSDAGGLPELVADGSGLVVPAADPRGLATALLDLLGPDGPAEAFAHRAVAGARASDWTQVGAMTLAAYERHLS